MKYVNKKTMIVVAMLLISVMIFAQPQKPNRDNMPQERPQNDMQMEGRPFMEIMETLTETQRDKIHDIRMDYEKKNIDIRAAADKLELELQDLMRDDNPSEKNIINMIKKISEKRTELKINEVKMGFDIMDQLTDKQKEMIKGMPMHHFFGPRPMMKKMMNHKMEK